MAAQLTVSVGQYSDKGRKALNQDYLGLTVPQEPLLSSKGIAFAIADGISSSEVSDIASKAAVQGFLDDYYRTSETWSVKKSALQVINALNSWLFSQTQKSDFRFERDKGYVCTLSAVVIKSTHAHWFHLGDSRIYVLREGALRQLTQDHRHVESADKSYLSRAMGIFNQLEIDYDSIELKLNDVLILMTDGIYEFVNTNKLVELIDIHQQDLNLAAKIIADLALDNGSDDNLSLQILKVDSLPILDVKEKLQQLTELPFAPMLEVRQQFDGYHILKDIHASSRSHVYLAKDEIQGSDSRPLIIKTPSIDLRDDAAYLERFLQEEWVAKRINNVHVLKPYELTRQRHFLYTAFEYIDGQTLSQWMIDNPNPDVETVRKIVEQIAIGLGAFHRLEMLHQDLRPANIMIDKSGVVKIIDFGSTRVAGLEEIASPFETQHLLGTAQYSAPEYFLGEAGTPRSDLFSLAVITYQMLSGRLPYGAEVAKARSKNTQNKLIYHSVLHDDKDIPAWFDDTLKKALQPNPYKRHNELSEFVYELRHPNKAFLAKTRVPLLERNPVAFWQSISAILIVAVIVLLAR
ncbi:bifunctional protein-serine/threonine kinase/phosphatase [Paraglaciecola hydrolytica]|uniref:Protein kinase n=1 Tax=Paraglaciecola hydrolytica TaxID=1799789 RepID=A0A136A6Z6_9ALTE|nr:bifunctional protein-serine/threonine kinase/phosphatase [Paraglaciecola hydrolytica]KXI31002.1 protein kinase [Paraglaciecola hydrolytica]